MVRGRLRRPRHEGDEEHGRTGSSSPPFYCERQRQKAECLSLHARVYVYLASESEEERQAGTTARGTVCTSRIRMKGREKAKRRQGGSEREEERGSLRRRLAASTSDWLVGCGTVLLHTYSPARAAVVAFIYRRSPLSGASAAF